MKPILVYIAGPYRPSNKDERGKPFYTVAYNVAAASSTASAVVDVLSFAGVFPVTPHMNTAFFEDLHPSEPDSYWLNGTMAMLERCDAVILVNHPDIENSAGTRAEVERAIELGKPVYYSVDHAYKHLEDVGEMQPEYRLVKPDAQPASPTAESFAQLVVR